MNGTFPGRGQIGQMVTILYRWTYLRSKLGLPFPIFAYLLVLTATMVARLLVFKGSIVLGMGRHKVTMQ